MITFHTNGIYLSYNMELHITHDNYILNMTITDYDYQKYPTITYHTT